MSLLSPSLEAFWAVVQKNTVQDASKILGLTQTGVTQRIRSLERQLGVTLFIRSRKGMRLTADGEHLLNYVKISLENEGMTLAQLKNTAKDHSVRLNISGPSSIIRSRVIPNLLDLPQKFSYLRLGFHFSDTESILEQIKSGQVDVGFLHPKYVPNELDSKTLQPQKYVLVGSAEMKNELKKKSLAEVLMKWSMIDFNPQDEMTYNYLQQFKLLSKDQLKIKFNSRHFANNTDALAQMVSHGWGYSVLTEEFWNLNKNNVKLAALDPGHSYQYQLAMAWYPRVQMPDYMKELIKRVK